MAKKKPREDRSKAAAASGEPFNAAFAGLAGLRPEGAEPEPEPADDVPAATPVAPGIFPPGQKVVVRKEKKGRGGKTVTRVQGLGADPEGLADLARELAQALGCGAKLEDGDILLQGQQTTRAIAAIRERGAPRVIDGDAPSRRR